MLIDGFFRKQMAIYYYEKTSNCFLRLKAVTLFLRRQSKIYGLFFVETRLFEVEKLQL